MTAQGHRATASLWTLKTVSCVVRGKRAKAMGALLSGQHSGDLWRESLLQAAGFLMWSVCVLTLCFCSLGPCSIARACFLMCGRVGRLFVGSCCYHCACNETHTELEAVNLSPGLPVGINYSSRAAARMPNVFLWELCLASDGTRDCSSQPLQLRLVGSSPAKSCPCEMWRLWGLIPSAPR